MRDRLTQTDWTLVFTGYMAGAVLALILLQTFLSPLEARPGSPQSACQSARLETCKPEPRTLPNGCAIFARACEPERV